MLSKKMGWMGLLVRCVAPLGVSLFSMGCLTTVDDVSGEDSGAISCDVASFAGAKGIHDGRQHICLAIVPDGDNVPALCDDLQGIQVTACPTRSALGTCALTGFAETYYADNDLTADEAQEECLASSAHLGATWKAAE